FAFSPRKHQSAFGALLSRARAYLGPNATLETRSGTISLELHRSVLVPDPRIQKPMQDRLLRVVAERSNATPKEVAETVGVSMRVAQLMLAELAQDGLCTQTTEGRNARYSIEDSTFSAPTWQGTLTPA
ncbi:MAG: hypothetical protein AAGF12_16500, partial [Myxococcota bacterium]